MEAFLQLTVKSLPKTYKEKLHKSIFVRTSCHNWLDSSVEYKTSDGKGLMFYFTSRQSTHANKSDPADTESKKYSSYKEQNRRNEAFTKDRLAGGKEKQI